MTDHETILQKHNILLQVQELIRQDKVIEAIKTVRDATGLGLKESKELVDNLSNKDFNINNSFGKSNLDLHEEISGSKSLEENIRQLLQQNKKLEAVKLVCDTTDMDLLNAKNFVESFENGERSFNPESMTRFDHISVHMTNVNGIVTVKMKEGSNAEKIVYPNDPDWEKAKKMLGNKPELLKYEADFMDGKYPTPNRQSTLYVESSPSGKWILFFIVFCVIMLVLYFFYFKAEI